MSASARRHTRYTVPKDAMRTQQIKSKGLIAGLKGWADCQVRDLSYAGALVLSERKMGIGDHILMRLSLRSGWDLEFDGKVVNCGTDILSGQYKLGVAIDEPSSETSEHRFLQNLGATFEVAV